ncbi:reverse transcriptase domain-containing protein [Tanacetum coccineum]
MPNLSYLLVHMYPMELYLLMLTPTPNPLRVSLLDKPQVSFSKLRLVIPPLGEPLSTLHKEGSVTPFVCWIENYPLPNGLKMPSYVGSYDGKGDPDNFLHLFEGAIHMQIWLMLMACHIQQKRFTKTHLAVHSIKQRKGESVRAFATRIRTLVKHLSTDLPSTYKGLMEKTYTWIEAREVATNGAPNDQRYNFERSRNPHGTTAGDIKVEAGSPLIGDLITDFSLAYLKVQEIFSPQKRRKLAQRTIYLKAPPSKEGKSHSSPPTVMKGSNSSAPVIIKAKIFGREVGRVHMDSGRSCEVIYEQCLLKLKPSVQASKVDLQVLLVGFSGKKSWAIGEVLLEITIGEAPLSRSETLNFIIVRSNSLYNMLLGGTSKQKMGMVVFTIHGAVKFHTTQGIRTMFSTHESDKIGEGANKFRETSPANIEGVLNCTDVEEKIIVNSKYLEQTITIGKQLPEHFKERTITVNRKPFKTEHKLNKYSHIKPIKQKRRSLGPEGRDIMGGRASDMGSQPSHARVPLGILPKVLPGRLQRLPSDPNGRRRRGQDIILLLPKDAHRFKKRRSNVSKTSRQESISATLFARREEGHVPIYFVSRVLQGAKLNYPALEKLILALVYTVRRLRRYFQAYTVAILTNSPIKQAPTNPEKSGGESNKEMPKDFLIEVPPEDNRNKVGRKTDTKLEETKPSCEWKLYIDEASSSDGSAVGLMLINLKCKEYTYALRFKFVTTNNEAEYEALLAGLRIVQEMEIVNLTIFVDSQLLEYTIEHIRRNQNKKADALSKLASMTFEHLTKEVLVEARRSIEEKEVLQVETKEEESWMTPIHEYLLSGLLAEDSKESRKVKIKAPQYKLIRGIVYKKSFYTPWLRCIAPPKTDKVIKEIHEDCEKSKEQSAVRKIAEIGAIAAKNAWPFSHWGVSIIGPLPTAPKGLKFLAIAIKHSTKWIEAKPLTIVLWIHRALPRNNQKETPFRLTYGFEAIILSVESNVAKDDRGRLKEVTKRKESKEVALIEEAYYQNKLCMYHNKKSNHSTHKVGDFVLLLQNNKENPQSITLRNFDLEDMEFEYANSNTTAKLPILKLGEYEIWVIRIKQYFQIQDYALWDVIENGFRRLSVGLQSSSIPVTAEKRTNKKNDVKARGLLLMALPNEHQLAFNQYPNAKSMSATIEIRFGESLDSIFNRLQKIMNKPEVETISIDDLYNNFKIIEQKVKKYVGTSSGAQNIAFMTALSTSSTNDANTACPQVSTASPNVNVVNDLEAMDLKWKLSLLSARPKMYYQWTSKKIFINANDTAGYDKTKVECYNCHKLGYFSKECRAPRSKDGQFRNQDNTRK